MKLLKEQYVENTYFFKYSCLNNITSLYLCGWRIDSLGFWINDDAKKTFYFFFSHEYEPEE